MNPPFDNAVTRMEPKLIGSARRNETAIHAAFRKIRQGKPGSCIQIPHGMTWAEINAALDRREPTELARARWWASGWNRYQSDASRRTDRTARLARGVLLLQRPRRGYCRLRSALDRLLAATA